ncbi:hypothetical protein AKO1_012910 [Acrasis kona]|uniref:ATP synthase F0 subunit 6 n=1 Tax=Acrasis kona TaxID=1008807 RepID=A0AAW2YN31_9EUKA
MVTVISHITKAVPLFTFAVVVPLFCAVFTTYSPAMMLNIIKIVLHYLAVSLLWIVGFVSFIYLGIREYISQQSMTELRETLADSVRRQMPKFVLLMLSEEGLPQNMSLSAMMELAYDFFKKVSLWTIFGPLVVIKTFIKSLVLSASTSLLIAVILRLIVPILLPAVILKFTVPHALWWNMVYFSTKVFEIFGAIRLLSLIRILF